jgi:PhzF family phenazine biosynthesis protein
MKSPQGPIRCWQVDAFTDRPFGGNPAAVCWLDERASDEWMQAVAAEKNLSETAFVRRLEEGLELRWFTPTIEVDLCGHATLATAHALWSSGTVPTTEALRFQTKSGWLTCTRDGEFIELNFPATPSELSESTESLCQAMGARPAFVGRSRFDLLTVYETAQDVRNLQPDFVQLARIPVRGVIATAPSDDPKYDFVSRFFAPNCGVNEDPVCGSAHCCLTPYWAARLGKTKLMAYQASARGGVLRLELKGDRVVLGGRAVTVFQGELL